MTPDNEYSLDLKLFEELTETAEDQRGSHLSAAQIEAYVANQASPEDERLADLHLEACEQCLSAAERAVQAGTWLGQMQSSTTRSARVLQLLTSCGAIQSGFDYVMPSGAHIDRHISLTRLCWSDKTVDPIVEAVDWTLAQRGFDAILTHGWPMAHIARRLVWRFRSRVKTLIESEGHDPLIFSRGVPRGAAVAILTDVTLRGDLVARLRAKVLRAGARVAAELTVVDAREDRNGNQKLLSLCSIPIARSESPIVGPGGELQRRHFNPCSYNLTVRRVESRSPLQLFDRDPHFAQLWERVFVAGAYEHHHVDGSAHHNGFIDTERLLEHPLTGEAIVDDLASLLISQTERPPDVLVVPRRHRGRLVGMRLRETIYRTTNVMPAMVTVGIRRGRAHLPESSRRLLEGQSVVVCDSAAGHGETLDVLCDMARVAGAASVGAAIVISRLKESCEEAFRARLDGKFWRLYYFPTPSFMVSQSDPSACPYCAVKAAIATTAARLGLPALRALADSFDTGGGDRAHDQFVQPRVRPESGEDFLRRCERRMAGGVTLHALCTAMNDGMAPLELPEVQDASIAPAKRAAMLESLPAGALKWSGRWLERSVQDCLAPASPHQVWLAAANLLAREGRMDWIDHLTGQLGRSGNHRLPTHFWGWLVFDTVTYLSANPGHIAEVRSKMERIAAKTDSTVRGGVKQVLEAIEKVEVGC